MIRVGFILEGYDWLGGVNYYRNLLSALALICEPKVRPVMFVGNKTPEDIVQNFCSAEIVRSSVLDVATPAGFFRRVIRKFSGQRDLVLDVILRQHDIQVLSHYSGALPYWSSVKSIGWIPDFQYLHFPKYFTKDDRALREAAVDRVISNCHSLILSSVAAQEDLEKVSLVSISKSNVLHFVPEIDLSPSVVTKSDLEVRYGFKAPYFYLPNQFWIHKNHRIVIEALATLKKQGVTPMIVASGATYDHRFPEHFTDLLAFARREGVDTSFKVLGVIPYGDLLSLMRHSLAVINPSLFEGWSSTVEEAKALDKTVLLSTIPVHKEQSPNKGIYFDPLNAEDLAQKMIDVMCQEETSLENVARCSATYAEDRMNFALNYQNIVCRLFSENTLQDK